MGGGRTWRFDCMTDFVLGSTTRVKNAVRMRAFPASGANLHVPPPIESRLHTQKISLEFHEHKVY